MKKADQLEGAELDYWVAKACGWKGFEEAWTEFDPETDRYTVSYDQSDNTPIGDFYGRPWRKKLLCGIHPEISGLQPIRTFSNDWEECGPLIERFGVGLIQNGADGIPDITQQPGSWTAEVYRVDGILYEQVLADGPTPQIAICRAVVKSKFGEEVGND